MAFNLRLRVGLDDDEVEPLLEDYVADTINAFLASAPSIHWEKSWKPKSKRPASIPILMNETVSVGQCTAPIGQRRVTIKKAGASRGRKSGWQTQASVLVQPSR
ncbi:MAG: hypothetical protein HC910_09395 [Spirulinaceae cyanobacterium SM2_1_0]|nr:hypothetical protein [Spirulinaceae cyanobacterium SM2_1_0]